MKKLFAFILAAVMALTLFACSKAPAPEPSPRYASGSAVRTAT